jgi:hypothetical protein
MLVNDAVLATVYFVMTGLTIKYTSTVGFWLVWMLTLWLIFCFISPVIRLLQEIASRLNNWLALKQRITEYVQNSPYMKR